MYQISGDLKDFVESGVAVVVGTADARGRPHVSTGWAPEVGHDGRSLAIYIETARAAEALADVAETGKMAITVAAPVSYRSIQFKGRCTGTRLATKAEDDWVRAHFEAFQAATALVGDPPEAIRNFKLTCDMRRFEIEIESAFDQTPGPEAGKQL